MRDKIQHFLELLFAMTEKELKIRYKNTTLGFLWAIVYPVLQAVIIGFVFQFFYKNVNANYGYFLFLNLLLWNFFSATLETATSSIVFNRSIVKKAKFTYMVIPLSIALCNSIHLVVSLSLFALYALIFNISSVFNVLAIILSLVLLFLFTIGLSLITSSLNVRARDISFITRAGIMIWFYATPVVYSLSIIPNEILYLWKINPLTSAATYIQNGFFGTPTFPSIIFENIVVAFIVFISGIFIFQKTKDYFDDYI